MIVKVDVDEKEFGENISEGTMTDVAQDIIDRYCNSQYYNIEELEKIANNTFGD